MSSHKRFKSIAHSIAHHAVSGLSFVNPHLSEACEERGLGSIEIELVSIDPCPKEFVGINPIYLSINNLKKTFIGIIEKEGLEYYDLSSAKVEFTFYHGKRDHYCSNCKATLKSTEGKVYISAVDYVGNEIRT